MEGLTAECEELLYAQIRVTHAHQDDLLGVEPFEVVIPEVAKELLSLVLEFRLAELGLESRPIIRLSQVLGEIDVENSEALSNSPVDIRSDRICCDGIMW